MEIIRHENKKIKDEMDHFFVFQTHPSDLIRRNNGTGEQISRLRNKLDIVGREGKETIFLPSLKLTIDILLFPSRLLVDFFSPRR